MNELLQSSYEEVLHTLECPQCKLILTDPILLRCGCAMCSGCIVDFDVKVCCKKKVTDKDRCRKYKLLTEIIDQLRAIGVLFQDTPDNRGDSVPNTISSKCATKLLNAESILSGTGNVTDCMHGDALAETIQIRDSLRADNVVDCLPQPLILRSSSSTSALPDVTPASLSHLYSVCPILKPSQEVMDLDVTQRTSQGGFVLDSQNSQTQGGNQGGEERGRGGDGDEERARRSVSCEQRIAGLSSIMVVPDTFIDYDVDIDSSPRECPRSCSPSATHRRHGLYQHGGGDLVLTSSTSTLSPTQVVDSNKDNVSNESGNHCPEGIIGTEIVPATFALEEERTVPATLSPSDDEYPLGGEGGCEGGRVRPGVVADSFADLATGVVVTSSLANDHFHPARGSSVEDDRHRGRIVCDTYTAKDDVIIDMMCRERSASTTNVGTPESELTQSSMYNVPDSCVEESASTPSHSRPWRSGIGRGDTERGSPSARVGHMSDSEKMTLMEVENPSCNKKAVISTLEGDWLGDDYSEDEETIDKVQQDDENEGRHREAVPQPLSLTQGYEDRENEHRTGMPRKSCFLSPNLSSSLISPAAHVDIHLDLSFDCNASDHSVQKRLKSSESGDGSDDGPLIASVSTISGSMGGAESRVVYDLHQLTALDMKSEGTDVHSSLYEVESDDDVDVKGDVAIVDMNKRAEKVVAKTDLHSRTEYLDSGRQAASRGVGGDIRHVLSDTPVPPAACQSTKSAQLSTCTGSSYSSSSYNGVDGGSELASWAKSDHKLLNKLTHLLKMLPEETSPVDMEAGQLKDTSESFGNPVVAGVKHDRVSITDAPSPDQRNEVTEGLDSALKDRSSSSLRGADKPVDDVLFPPPSVPHFTIILSNAVSRDTVNLKDECEKRGLFMTYPGAWMSAGDSQQTQDKALPSSVITTHLLLVEAETCHQPLTSSGVVRTSAVISQCPRTMSFMRALCLGHWVIDAPRWLKACLREGRNVDLTQFEVSRSVGAPLTFAPARARTSPRLQTDPMRSVLLDQCTILLKNFRATSKVNHKSGQSPRKRNVTIGIKDVSFFIHYGGGEVLDYPEEASGVCLCESCKQLNHSLANNEILVLHSGQVGKVAGKKRKQSHVNTAESDHVMTSSLVQCLNCHTNVVKSPQSQTIPEVTLAWLVDSICSFEKQPIDKYLMSTSKQLID